MIQRPFACRYCRHDVDKHNLIQGCPFCTCAATPGEGNPRTDVQLDAAVLATDKVISHYMLRIPKPPAPRVPTDEERMRAARKVALWHIGDGSWADLIVGAYLNPDAALEALRAEKES